MSGRRWLRDRPSSGLCVLLEEPNAMDEERLGPLDYHDPHRSVGPDLELPQFGARIPLRDPELSRLASGLDVPVLLVMHCCLERGLLRRVLGLDSGEDDGRGLDPGEGKDREEDEKPD